MKTKRILLILLAATMIVVSALAFASCGKGVVLVRFYVDDELYQTVRVDKGGALDDIPEVPKKEGYTGSWSVTNFDEISADLNVSAVYVPDSFRISFYADGVLVKRIVLKKGQKNQNLSEVPEVPVKEGYAGKWSVTNFAELTKDTDVFAEYTKNAVNATFYEDSFTYTPATVSVGATVQGAYYEQDGDTYVRTTDAKFVRNKTYFTRSRKWYATVPVQNGRVTPPNPPTKDGLSAEWVAVTTNADGTETLSAAKFTGIEKDVSFTVRFYVTLTLVDPYGTGTLERKFDVGATARDGDVLPAGNKEEYEFYSWCDDEGFSSYVIYPHMFTKNETWYAKWLSVRASEGLRFDGSTVTGYEGTDTEVYVPYRYTDGSGVPHEVVSVGENAFENGSLTKIHLPATLTSVGEGAFKGCGDLTGVLFDDGNFLTEIGAEAFASCASLTSFGFSTCLETLGESAFEGCVALRRLTGLASVSVTVVSDRVFKDCSSLEEIRLSSGTEEIGAYAFANCSAASFVFSDLSALRAVGAYAFSDCALFTGFVADGVTEVEANAYEGCYGMTEATVSAKEEKAASAFGTYAVLSEEEKTRYYKAGDFAVPKYLYTLTVVGSGENTALGTDALYDLSSVKSVRLVGLTEIEPYAFRLENNPATEGECAVSLPQTLLTIGDNAFATRNDVVRIVLPATLMSVGENAFKGLNRLAYVTLPDRNALASVGAHAFAETEWFENCDRVVVLGKCVLGVSGAYCRRTGYSEVKAADMGYAEVIAPYAFYGDEYIRSVTLGRYVVTIGDYAFANVSRLQAFAFNGISGLMSDRSLGTTVLAGVELTDLTVYEDVTVEDLFDDVPDTLTKLTVLYGGGATTVQKDTYAALTTIEEIVIGEGYTAIGEEAFSFATDVCRVTLPASVRTVGAKAFSGTATSTLTIADEARLTSIGESAFENTRLTSVSFPSTVTTIGKKAFRNTRLTSFVAPESLTSVGESAFEGILSLTSVELNDGLTDLGSFAFYGCSVRVLRLPASLAQGYWGEDGETQVSIGKGAFGNDSSLTTLNLEWGIKANDLFEDKDGVVRTPANLAVVRIFAGDVPADAFAQDAYIQTLTLAKGVTGIGDRAFKGCSAIRSVTVPNTVRFIGEEAFASCEKLSSCQIDTTSSALTTVGKEIFKGDAELRYAVFPSTLRDGDWTGMFDGCAELTTANLPACVTTIGAYAFRGCASLVRVQMHDGVTAMEEGAFEGCSSIDFDDVKFNELIELGEGVFRGCASMRALKGKALTAVGQDAYAGCDKIEEITIADRDISYYTDKKAIVNTVNVVGSTVTTTFDGCDALQTVVFYAADAETVVGRTAGVDTDAVTVFVLCSAYEAMTPAVRTAYHPFPTDAALFTYATNNASGTASVTGTTTAFDDPQRFDGVAYLPEEVTVGDRTFAVTSVGTDAFRGKTALRSIVIPASVTSVGANAFKDCTALESLRFENGSDLEAIRASAFSGCTALEKIVFPSSLTTVENNAFQNCSSVVSASFYANSKLTTIGSYAFGGMTSLTEWIGTGEIRQVGNNAFNGCTSLARVDFGAKATFTELGSYVFGGCVALAKAGLPDTVRSIGTGAFRGCTSLSSIDLPAATVTIGTSAFAQSGLVTVTFNDALREIGQSAFESCEKLTSAYLPDGVTSVGKDAFKNAFALTEIRFGAGLTTIGSGAFDSARSLTSILFDAVFADDLSENNGVFRYAGRSAGGVTLTIGSTVRRIPAQFLNATGEADTAPYVTNIVFMETSDCRELGEEAFVNLTELRNVTLPVCVLRAGARVFAACNALTLKCEAAKAPAGFDERWDEGLTSGVTYKANNVSSGSYDYVLHEGKAYLTAYRGAATDVVVPDELLGASVAGIGAAFEKNTGLLSVTLSERVTDIGSFYGCSSLHRVTTLGRIEEIPDRAFYGCASLNGVVVGEDVSSIGKDAFYGCDSLVTVYVESETIAALLGENQSVGTMMTHVLSVYAKADTVGVGSEYKRLPVQKDGYDVFTKLYSDEGKTTEDTVYVYWMEDGEDTYALTVGGNGDMRDYVASSLMKWYSYVDRITSVTVGEGVNTLAKNAFADMTALRNVYYNATNATFTENKTAFAGSGAEGLALTLGDDVTTIPPYLFKDNTRLASVTFGSKGALTTIGENAFYGCTALKNVVLPAGLVTVKETAFAYAGLTSVTVSASVTDFGLRAFYGNADLRSVYYNAVSIPDDNGNESVFGSSTGGAAYGEGFTLYVGEGVRRIPAYAFSECNNLLAVSFTERGALTEIGREAFYKCEYVSSMTIPTTVVKIGVRAFADSTALGTISFGAGTPALTEIGAEALLNTAFYNDNGNWTTPESGDTTQSVLYFRNRYLIKARSGLAGEYAISGAAIVACEAFYGCNALEYVRIPADVTFIGAGAFEGCAKLTTVYVSSATVAKGLDGETAFGSLVKYATHVYVLQSLIDETKIKVGKYVADSFTAIRAVVNFVKGSYYAYTKAAWSVGKTTDVLAYLINDEKRVGFYELRLSGWGETADYAAGTSPWREYLAQISFATVETGVSGLGSATFYGCSALTAVTMPLSLTKIGENAFNGCSSLTAVDIKDNVTSIGNGAFAECTSLSRIVFSAKDAEDLVTNNNVFLHAGRDVESGVSVEISRYVKHVPAYLFNPASDEDGAAKIKTVRFVGYADQHDCAWIGKYAFAYNTELVAVTFSAAGDLATIEEGAFYGCSNLASVNLIAAITRVGVYAFKDCTALTSVAFNAVNFTENPVDSNAFENAGMYAGGFRLEVSHRTKSVPSHLFEGAAYMVSVLFEEGGVLETIGENAFEDCTSLQTVTVPNTVKTIGEGAFSGCTSLAKYVAPFIGGKEAQTSGSELTLFGYVFGETTKLGCIMTEQSYGSAASMFYWIPESLKTVEITKYTNVYYGAFENCAGITRITIRMTEGLGIDTIIRQETDENGNTHVAEMVLNGSVLDAEAFYRCSSLVSVTLPPQVEAIGKSAFEGCSALTQITISENVAQIGTYAFKDCRSLRSIAFNATECEDTVKDGATYNVFANAGAEQSGIDVTFGANVKRVPAYLFAVALKDALNPKLSSVSFETDGVLDGGRVIGEKAFYQAGRSTLTSISLPTDVVSVGAGAFDGTAYWNDDGNWNGAVLYIGQYLIKAQLTTATSVTEYTVTNGVTVIADEAFRDCEYLVTVSIPNTVKYVGKSAFYSCKSLVDVRIDSASAMTAIGQKAFYGCEKLGSQDVGFRIAANVTTIGDDAFNMASALKILYLDSKTVASGLSSDSFLVFGGVAHYADTIHVNDEIKSLGAFVGNNFQTSGTSVGGYKIYTKR